MHRVSQGFKIVRHMLPEWAATEVKLRRLRRRYPQAKYILSPYVSRAASLGQSVGIGSDVVINDGVSIGSFSYVNRGSIVFSGSIGSYCSIAHMVQIGGENHPTRFLSTSPDIYLSEHSPAFNEISDPPEIGSDVWIGGGATILQGVSVGHGAVVGAGAVVTKDVEPYSVVAGIPARTISYRFGEDVRTALLNSEWWLTDVRSDPALRELVALGPQFVDRPDLLARVGATAAGDLGPDTGVIGS